MILEKIKAILNAQFDVEEDSITQDTDFIKDLNADSLDIADLLSTIAGEFEIDVESEPIENFKTVGDLVEFIE
ncbi:MAG: acyl carrier protein, partial [Firmicutes bacterium]|nr:acyl carrier protein [Bacillota bacterium]